MPRRIALPFFQHRHLSLKAIVLAVICVAAALQAAPVSAQQGTTRPTECWRGWGYLLDGQSRAYKSQEMLLVTLGPTLWEAGRPVELFLLDRASGHISEVPPITVIPEGPRLYYRGRLNYMDTVAAIQGSQDLMTLGLSHIEPAQPGVPAKEQYNRWACGLGEE